MFLFLPKPELYRTSKYREKKMICQKIIWKYDVLQYQ